MDNNIIIRLIILMMMECKKTSSVGRALSLAIIICWKVWARHSPALWDNWVPMTHEAVVNYIKPQTHTDFFAYKLTQYRKKTYTIYGQQYSYSFQASRTTQVNK